MLPTLINGFTLIATRQESHGYVVLAVRQHVDGFEYATAWMRNLHDREWFGGNYFNTRNGETIREATENYYARR